MTTDPPADGDDPGPHPDAAAIHAEVARQNELRRQIEADRLLAEALRRDEEDPT